MDAGNGVIPATMEECARIEDFINQALKDNASS